MHKRDKKDSYRRRIEELIEGGHSGKRSKRSQRTSEKSDNNNDDIILVTGNIDNSSSNITNANITNASTTNTNTTTTNANTSNVNTITAQRWVPGNAGIHKYSGLNKINL
jgi:hypothetical protein